MANANGKKGRSRKGPRWEHLTDEEVLSVVANLIVRGMKLSDIVAYMKNYYKEENFKKSDPYHYLRRAAERGMFEFVLSDADGRDHVLEDKIRNKYPKLNTVAVVKTVVGSDVADRAARVFIEFVQHKADRGVETVRVGLMGGGTIMAVCRALARALARLDESEKLRLPRLTFQALAVGESVREPLEDPASFFTYFADVTLNPLRRDYVSLHAPVFRALGERAEDSGEFEILRAEARSCDIVLLSAGSFADEHSFLGALQVSAPEVWKNLSENDCKGDLGRLPVNQEGPMPLDLFPSPPCTLVQLSDLQAMVREDRRVMVVAAPCGHCRRDKSDVLQTLLEVHKRGIKLFSDLVCDSLTVRSMPALNMSPPRNA
jgi:hypothetical protein